MYLNALKLAVRELRRNVLRSALTMLGIVIGVAAVIIMVTIGGGATQSVSSQISSLGVNMLMLTPGQFRGPGGASGEADMFKLEDAIAIKRDLRNIQAVAPLATKNITAIFGNQNWNTSVNGTDNDFFKVRDWAVAFGREFTENEIRSGKAVCILGATVSKALFGSREAIGETIRLGNLSCRIIGILEAKGQSMMGTDRDDLVVIPLKLCWRRITGNLDVGMIQIAAESADATAQIQQDVERLMRERRKISDREEDDFTVRSIQELTEMMTGTTQVLTMLLSAVAAVSLLVGGIGIMNIMLVSVTERTREIGIRLAIGAMEREVLMQFLVEAVVLSTIGGIVGVALALVSSVILSDLLQVPFVLNLPIVIIALGFAGAVGVLFGYFPARKAASLDPIEALRHE